MGSYQSSDNLLRPLYVQEAIAQIADNMSLKDKALIARVAESEVETLEEILARFMQRWLAVWLQDKMFFDNCVKETRQYGWDENAINRMMVRKLWEKLKGEYCLRVI